MKVKIGTDLELASQLLNEQRLVAIPTETVYGLAGNALEADTVLQIFEVKQRPSFDPLILHTHSLEALEAYVEEIPFHAQALATAFWPGPLTLLLPKKPVVPDLVTSGLDTVAVRIPNHPTTLALLRQLSFPLAAPSANPFGYISPTTAQHVADQLGDKIDYILDGGPCQVGIESTIIGFPEGIPTIYRLGGIALEAIESVIGKVASLPHSTSNPKAPGMLKSHYAPRKPLILVDTITEEHLTDDNVGLLTYNKLFDTVPVVNQRVLTHSDNLQEAAHNLFTYLRELDQLGISKIYAERVPQTGLGRAINDRLKRAAALPE